MDKPRYLRLENVVFIKLEEGETQEEAEQRYLNALPEGIDVVSYRSQYWDND